MKELVSRGRGRVRVLLEGGDEEEEDEKEGEKKRMAWRARGEYNRCPTVNSARLEIMQRNAR